MSAWCRRPRSRAFRGRRSRAEPWEPNVTALLDPASLKWKDLASAAVALPTPWRPRTNALFREEETRDTWLLNEGPHAHVVGAFGETNYEARGYYRPQADCIMFTRDNVPFCAVCRRAIEQILDLYSRAAVRP